MTSLIQAPAIQILVQAICQYSFTVSPAYQITNFATTYNILLWDNDGDDFSPNSDDFVGGYPFNLSTFAQSRYSATAILYTTRSNIKIELNLLWQ